MRNAYKFWSRNLKGRNHLVDLDVDGRIMCISEVGLKRLCFSRASFMKTMRQGKVILGIGLSNMTFIEN
jgi:hypothetical protein